ncbi:metacaspase-2-like [Daktulosphaira vitifoliae]|uniref:metacaspase-2-like n=1 Tax=Daktulosphaira vitifoliae TaxID=58002 RepID=UPI0021AA4C22|nr:metacaspase-2-like [Daktulosphaira vitifoliae]
MSSKDTSTLNFRKVENESNENLGNNCFDKMIDLCRTINSFPLIYIEDMVDMYNKCIQKNSLKLNELIDEGLKNITPSNKKSFQYAANVYNELLQLTKNISTNLESNSCIASSSKGNSSLAIDNNTEKKKENCSISLNLFNDLIEKCTQNFNFPKSNIKLIDQLYKSLPSEFTESKMFISLLTETNQKVWPDSGHSSYVYVQHIYEQLQQFKTSEMYQEKNVKCDHETIAKVNRNMKKLKKAFKIVRKKIKMLNEKEMNVSDDDDFDVGSAYILRDKYEKKAVEIYKKMCKLKEEPNFLENPPIRFKSTKNVLVNKTIEKYYNINKSFPDYFEVYTLLKTLNEKKKLNWSEKELSSISQDAFLKLGKQLKVLRLNDYFSSLSDMITDKDPAEENEELKKKLEESNKKLNEDLNKLTKEFECKQEEQEETEGSSLNNTECECSSNDEFDHKKIKNNVLREKPKMISTRRKQSPNFNSDNNLDSTNIKSENNLSVDFKPCTVQLTPLNKIKINSNNGTNNEPKHVTENLNDVNKIFDEKLVENCTNKENNFTCKIDLDTQEECQSINNVKINDTDKLKINEVHTNKNNNILQADSEVLQKKINTDKLIEMIEHDDSESDIEITMCSVNDNGNLRKRLKFQNDPKINSNIQKINRKIHNNSAVSTPKTSKFPQYFQNSSNNYQCPSNMNQNYGITFNQQRQESSISALSNSVLTKYYTPSTSISPNHSRAVRTNMQQRQITSNIVQQHKGYNRVTKMTTTTTTVVEQSAQHINCYRNSISSQNSRRIIPQTNRSPELIELD